VLAMSGQFSFSFRCLGRREMHDSRERRKLDGRTLPSRRKPGARFK
jgi:hypothetical protein